MKEAQDVSDRLEVKKCQVWSQSSTFLFCYTWNTEPGTLEQMSDQGHNFQGNNM